jgi:hypothetical protein
MPFMMNKTTLATLIAPLLAVAAQNDQKVIYKNPEQISEHEWDRDLFRKDAQVISTHLEFLYWVPVEGSLMYAVEGNQINPHGDYSGTSGALGKYKNGTFDIDPGFRIGLSFYRAPHYWEAWAQYTRMTNRGHNSVEKPPNYYLNGTWPTFTLVTVLDKATSDVHLNYNVVDAFFDRFFQPNPHLRLRLLAGLSGAWMNQDQEVRYYDNAGTTVLVKNSWSYNGVGARFGMMGDWFWIWDCYMTAKFTMAGLFGPYKNISFESSNEGPAFTTEPLVNATYKDTRGIMNLQLLLGPSYQKSFTKWRLELFGGFEANLWYNLQEVYRSIFFESSFNDDFPWTAQIPIVNTGPLTLFGLTTRMTVDF